MNESIAGSGLKADASNSVRLQVRSRKPAREARLRSSHGRFLGAAAGLFGLFLATVAAAATPTLAKAFGAASIAVGQTTSLTFTIDNPNAGSALTNVSFNDSLPSGLVVATPNGLANSCGGSVSAPAAGTFLQMNAVTLAPGASCTWSINVLATSAGIKNNTTSAISSTETGPGSSASASITVPLPADPVLTKAFGAASIKIGQTTSLTFSLSNPNATFTTLTNIAFNDGLPSGLVVATPNGLANSCGGSVSAPAAGTFLQMTTVTLAPGASCTWSINVLATSAGTKNNTTSVPSSTESGSGGIAATASLTVPLPADPVLTKAFGAASIKIGQTTSLTFSLSNPNATFTTLTNIAFNDGLPSGLVVATPNGLANSCGGSVSAPAAGTFLQMTTVTLAPGASCTWSINVLATSAGTKNNTTSVPSSTESGSGGIAATASLTVPLPADPVLTKAFGAASIKIGQTTSLTFSLSNPNATFTTLTNIAFNDGLPSGLVVATPNGLANSCGGSVSAPAAGTFLQMTTVTLAPGASCTWSINVLATSAGTKNNTTSVPSSTESGSGGIAATASLTVPLPADPVLTKAFGAASIAIGQTTSLTFSLSNPNATFTTLTNIAFNDGLPSGLVVATPNGLANSCGGSVSAPAAGTFLQMTTVTLAPGASCTWSINVLATSAGTKNNTTSVPSSTESGSGGIAATASITVLGPAQLLSKGSRKTHGAAGTFDLLLAP